MSRAIYSVAMPCDVEQVARTHLLRPDGQEDICFALWRPSTGATRKTALIQQLILPEAADRDVHGNVSFTPAYLVRALEAAANVGAGLAMMHSHPRGRGWQGMSPDDIVAENGNAGAVYGATGLPFVGLTLAADGAWSARFWERQAPRVYGRCDCASVRVVGNEFKVTYLDALAPRPLATGEQVRTVSAWGEVKQADLVRLRVGIVGAGSVGGFIAEAQARTGIEDITIIDFDVIEPKNLDRLVYAMRQDTGKLKVTRLAEYLTQCATAQPFRVHAVTSAVYDDEGYRAALDCDVIFACVDRPWGRHVLNTLAYAHLIPVIDGGIAVRANTRIGLVAADWRAHTAMPGRRCLHCIGQYDTGFVQTEREGKLDDPKYIEGLAHDHPLRTGENVIAFSMACASLQVLQMLALVLNPMGEYSNPGEQLYHFVGDGMAKPTFGQCRDGCSFNENIAAGDHFPFHVTK